MLIAHNFAVATVSTGYDAAATSIVLTTGHGARLPSAGPFRCVWWNQTDYPNPADDPNREIVEVTARSTDTLTVVRGRETSYGGLAASTKNTAAKTYGIALVQTADAARSPSLVEVFDGSSDIWRPTVLNTILSRCVPNQHDMHSLGSSGTVTGSGTTGQINAYELDVNTGTTASSTARRGYQANEYFSWAAVPVDGATTTNYNRPFAIGFQFRMTGGFEGDATNHVWRATWGKYASDAVAELARKGLGVQIDAKTLKGIYHNGTSLSTVAFSGLSALGNTDSMRIIIYNHGDGNITWYGSRAGAAWEVLATVSDGPTAGGNGSFQTEIQNGADAVAYNIRTRFPYIIAL